MPTPTATDSKTITTHVFTLGGNSLVGTSAKLAGPVHTEQLHGRDHLVVPAVLVQSQVLENNLGASFLPPDEFTEQWAEQWNGAPVVISEHPTLRGQPVSARDPEVLNSMGVGFVFHAQVEHEEGQAKLTAQIWLDLDRAAEVVALAEIVKRLRHGELVELSTGFPTLAEETTGTYNGQEYDLVLHPSGVDHLAIFTDKVGACSLTDGCGLGVSEQEGDVADSEKVAAGLLASALKMLKGGNADEVTVVETGPEFRVLLRRMKMIGLSCADIGEAIGQSSSVVSQIERGVIRHPEADVLAKLQKFVETANDKHELSDDDKRTRIGEALGERFGGTDRFVWIDSVFSDDSQVVFGVVHETLDGRREDLFMASFEFDNETEVTFTEPQMVTKRTVFDPVTPVDNARKESNMDKKEMIAQLVKRGTLAEDVLDTLSENELKALCGVEQASGNANATATDVDAEKVAAEKVAAEAAAKAAAAGSDAEHKETDEAKSADREQVEALIAESKALREEVTELKAITTPVVEDQKRDRAELMGVLSKNERVSSQFTEDELNAKSTAELHKIDAMTRVSNFTGRRGPSVGSQGEVEPQFMPTTRYWETNEKDKEGGKE